MTYALDTNTIVDFINGDLAVLTQFRNTVKNKVPMVIPSVVDYEITRGFYHTRSAYKENSYGKMRLNCPVVDVNAEIWDCAASLWAKLRKAGRTIGDADILIAAHCITNGYTVITHNTKHFADIDGLKMEDWVG